MEKLDVKYRPGRDYRELFDITVDSIHCETTEIGITPTGTLIYLTTKLINYSSAYDVEAEFFTIDKDEFRHFLSIAGENGHIEKAIRLGKTTEEELQRLSQ